jgi:hypothetical protein
MYAEPLTNHEEKPCRDDERERKNDTEEMNNPVAGEETAPTCGQEVQHQDEGWVEIQRIIGETPIDNLHRDHIGDDVICEIRSYRQTHKRNESQNLLSVLIRFQKHDSERNKDRPQHVREQYICIRGDSMEQRRTERKPHHPFDRLLDPEQKRDTGERKLGFRLGPPKNPLNGRPY